MLNEKAKSGQIGPLAVDCLTALQHRYILQLFTSNSILSRGTEGSGLVGSDGTMQNHFEIAKGHGLVRDVYSVENVAKFNGNLILLNTHSVFSDSMAVIGHNRYSTAGMKAAINCIQPFVSSLNIFLTFR